MRIRGMMSSSPLATSRRRLLFAAAAFAAGGAPLARAAGRDPYAGSPWRTRTAAAWRADLPEAAYRVLREEATEYPFTSPLNAEHRRGVFVCRGCELPLFRSDWKFDSGTGWPSFYRALDGAIGEKDDFQLAMRRTEYHCARCLGHQGHVFDDGPRPTGLRYCNNGVALSFRPG